MKKTVWMAMALMAFVATAQAQHRPRNGFTPEQRIEKRLERLDKELDLTDEQEKKIKALYEEFFKDRKGSREDRQEAQKQLDEKVKALLTTEQQEIFAKMKKGK